MIHIRWLVSYAPKHLRFLPSTPRRGEILVRQNYLLAARVPEVLLVDQSQKFRIPFKDIVDGPYEGIMLNLRDQLLIARIRGGVLERIQPRAFQVIEVDNSGLTIEPIESFLPPVPLDKVRSTLNRTLSSGAWLRFRLSRWLYFQSLTHIW